MAHSRAAKKRRKLRVARMILEGLSNEDIITEVKGINIYEVTGMRGFLSSGRGRKWAVDKGFVEAPAKATLTPQAEKEGKQIEGPSTTSTASPEKPQVITDPTETPSSPQFQPIQKAVPSKPLKATQTPALPRTRVSEEVVEVEVMGVPRKMKVSAETLLWYSWFLEGRLPIQKKPFEGSLGDFFDFVVRDFFHSRGCQFVVRFEKEVA